MLYRAAGYYLTVTTWENDADNYKTLSVHYTDPEQLRVGVKLCEMFSSTNDDECPGIGNLQYGEEHEAISAFHKLVEENPGIIPVTLEQIEDHEDKYFVYQLLKYVPSVGIMSSEYYLTRVVEKIVVEYFAEDIHCEDVTDQFVRG